MRCGNAASRIAFMAAEGCWRSFDPLARTRRRWFAGGIYAHFKRGIAKRWAGTYLVDLAHWRGRSRSPVVPLAVRDATWGRQEASLAGDVASVRWILAGSIC